VFAMQPPPIVPGHPAPTMKTSEGFHFRPTGPFVFDTPTGQRRTPSARPPPCRESASRTRQGGQLQPSAPAGRRARRPPVRRRPLTPFRALTRHPRARRIASLSGLFKRREANLTRTLYVIVAMEWGRCGGCQ
jgi:hypothetical protein